jgi:hypothetical protein
VSSNSATHPVLVRRWKYAAPPWRMHEALVHERDQWLEPCYEEHVPRLATVEPQRVVMAPWLDPDIATVEVNVATDGEQGSELTVLVHASHDLAPDRRKAVKYRLGTLFGEALREWVDGP